MNVTRCLAVALTVVVAAGPSSAQNLDGLVEDARSYAFEFGVDLDEAVRRLELQDAVGELDKRLTTEESATFAGLWIEHSPEFRIITRFTDRYAGRRIRSYLADGPLAALVEVRPADHSLVKLEAAQAAALFLARELGVPVEAGINVYQNRAELYVLDRAWLEELLVKANLRLPTEVAVVEVDALSTDVAIEIYAGLALTTCTSSFSIKNASGTQGILTAGHCGPNQAYFGNTLPYQDERCGGDNDFQWHTAPGLTVRPWFRDEGLQAFLNRAVTGTKSRTSQSIGEYVCKHGMTTGYTCGTISDKNFAPSSQTCTTHTATFIRFGARADSGDSGGPAFKGNTAYGVIKCRIGSNEACYMAIDRISALGLTVLTGPLEPTNVAIGACTNCLPNVTWTRSASPSISYQELWRQTYPEGWRLFVTLSSTVSSYVDSSATIVSSGAQDSYCYKVRAVNQSGQSTPFSNVRCAAVKECPPWYCP